jgi:ParB family chromosome partitioning protein
MTEPAPEIRSVPVDHITVLNPRVRNKRIFQELVNSIAHLGLKKPITVSQRPGKARYDLVCGQGRLEAFIALGQTEIPAVVIDAAEEDCFVMSLVENLARRQHSPLELVHAIGALNARGYSYAEIAAKVDFSLEYVSAICLLLENGEEKLIAAVERGVIPHTIAMEIARAKDGEVQQALAQAYEEKTIPGKQVLAIRKIIDQRNTSGKGSQQRVSTWELEETDHLAGAHPRLSARDGATETPDQARVAGTQSPALRSQRDASPSCRRAFRHAAARRRSQHVTAGARRAHRFRIGSIWQTRSRSPSSARS